MHTKVHGINLDAQTRCIHWHSPLDVIAIKTGCCDKYYACHSCHDELEDHLLRPLPQTYRHQPSVLCGVCQTELTLETYLNSSHTCPHCQANFNPGCQYHYPLYFDLERNNPHPMTNDQILSYVDHTLLSPTADWTSIQALCKEAVQYKTASACIPPSFVEQARLAFPTLNICTVVGFPLGYSTIETKMTEVQGALVRGANEIDTVINIGHAKMGLLYEITTELEQLKKACKHHILKVIIETCYLTDDEKIAMCKAVSNSGADYIKTSTGFGSGGATPNDIRLFKAHVATHVKIKAAGGMSSKEALIQFIELGASRLGTSKAVGLLTKRENNNDY